MVIKWTREVLTGPGLGGMLEGLYLGDNCASRIIRYPSIRPSVDGGGEETRAFEPGVLESEPMGFRDGGRDGEDERDVVGGGAEAGGEHGVGECGGEGVVDEHSI